MTRFHDNHLAPKLLTRNVHQNDKHTEKEKQKKNPFKISQIPISNWTIGIHNNWRVESPRCVLQIKTFSPQLFHPDTICHRDKLCPQPGSKCQKISHKSIKWQCLVSWMLISDSGTFQHSPTTPNNHLAPKTNIQDDISVFSSLSWMLSPDSGPQNMLRPIEVSPEVILIKALLYTWTQTPHMEPHASNASYCGCKPAISFSPIFLMFRAFNIETAATKVENENTDTNTIDWNVESRDEWLSFKCKTNSCNCRFPTNTRCLQMNL